MAIIPLTGLNNPVGGVSFSVILRDLCGQSFMPRFDDILDKSLTCIVQPTEEPLELDLVKKHCGLPVSVTEFDDLFTSQIKSAREQVESDCERAFLEQTWRLKLEQFPRPTPYYAGNLSQANFNIRQIELRRCPVIAIVAFTHIDTAGESQSLDVDDDYLQNLEHEPGLLTPPARQSWPACLPQMGCVTIDFTCGYEDADHVPERAKQAMRMLIAHWWRNREAASERPAKDHDRGYKSLIDSLKWRE